MIEISRKLCVLFDCDLSMSGDTECHEYLHACAGHAHALVFRNLIIMKCSWYRCMGRFSTLIIFPWDITQTSRGTRYGIITRAAAPFKAERPIRSDRVIANRGQSNQTKNISRLLGVFALRFVQNKSF